jgi:hypothetical protein
VECDTLRIWWMIWSLCEQYFTLNIMKDLISFVVKQIHYLKRSRCYVYHVFWQYKSVYCTHTLCSCVLYFSQWAPTICPVRFNRLDIVMEFWVYYWSKKLIFLYFLKRNWFVGGNFNNIYSFDFWQRGIFRPRGHAVYITSDCVWG